jgi:hypothetical protein
MISRRKLLSSLSLATVLAALPTVLMVPDAEAQTAGMERRENRRQGRQVRREGRREARQVRRGVPTGTGVTTGTAK